MKKFLLLILSLLLLLILVLSGRTVFARTNQSEFVSQEDGKVQNGLSVECATSGLFDKIIYGF